MQMRSLFLICFTLLLLIGCGKKGPVRPYEEKLPEAVSSARLLQRGAEFQLQWQAPERNLDGSALVDLDRVNIERLFIREAEFCSECRAPWPLIAKVRTDLPAPAQTVGALFLLSDSGAQPGQTARYRLQAVNRLGAFGPPLTLKQDYREPVAAPDGLSISAHDRSVELRWQATPIPTGAQLIGYQVYRRTAGELFQPLPLNLRPLERPEFSDFGLENSISYHYRIRSLFDFAGQRLESLPSGAVSVRPSAG